jgi:hypothetical protein
MVPTLGVSQSMAAVEVVRVPPLPRGDRASPLPGAADGSPPLAAGAPLLPVPALFEGPNLALGEVEFWR